jgi:flagellar biosynthesis protein
MNDTPHLDLKEGDALTPPHKPNKAVALHYDRELDAAPRIVASGKGLVADQILALAFAHGVRVREDADLVEILSLLEVDSLIPLEAFTAVAEILSYVYRANAIYKK